MILLCTFQHPLKMNRAFQPNLLKMLVQLEVNGDLRQEFHILGYWVTEFDVMFAVLLFQKEEFYYS
jgi:hypothetical protein